MLQATATIIKAATVATGSPVTHCYLLKVTTSRGSVVSYHITTAQAKALGFAPITQGGRQQIVQGWLYSNGQFGR